VKAAQGQAEEALELYRQALALDDSFVEAMLNAAEVLIHPLHDFEGAIAMIEEALDFADSPDETADALLLKYDACVHQGDKEGARRVVSSFPEGPFETARLDFLVGRALFESGEQRGAQRILSHAIELEPGYGDAHYTLGLVHEALGDGRAMIDEFLRAREADLALPAVAWAPSRPAFEELVRAAIARLPKPLFAVLERSQLFITELPGAEVIVDGVDPRTSVLFDTSERGADDHAHANANATANATASATHGQVARIFFYQRNAERAVEDALGLSDEIYLVLEDELCATFPELAPHATRPHTDEEHDSDH
jgi:tetratricopeptide (TPR) repeat protein